MLETQQSMLSLEAQVEQTAAALGFKRFRVYVATDDEFVFDVFKRHTRLDVFSRPQ